MLLRPHPGHTVTHSCSATQHSQRHKLYSRYPSKPGQQCTFTTQNTRHAKGLQRGLASAAVTGIAPTAAMSAAADTSHVPTPAARDTLFGAGSEQVSEVEATVIGKLPSWLSGSLLVNGGGDYSHMSHMFDGLALVTKVRVDGGRAWGCQRYLDTQARAAYKQQGRVVYREFATAPAASGPLEKCMQVLKQLGCLITNTPAFTDNASVSLQAVGASSSSSSKLLMAMSETVAASYIVNPEDLSTLKQVQYTDGVPGQLTTAHPSIVSDGTLINFNRTLPFGGFHIFKQDPITLQRTEVAFVADRRPLRPTWLHDFAATDKYAVIIEQPLYMSLLSLLVNTPASHLFMDWKPEDGVKVHVVPLDGQKAVRTFACPSFFFFHVGNAFESEDGKYLHVDLAAYDDAQILLDLVLQPLQSPRVSQAGELLQQISPSQYRRLSIPLQQQAAASAMLQAPEPIIQSAQQHQAEASSSSSSDPLGGYCEFPAINPARRGQSYRYAYCLSAVRPTNLGNALSKMDLQTGMGQTWHMPGGAVGEPVFVGRPGTTAEDDGVVLAPGVGPEGLGFMLVMDASSWTELARVQLQFGVPNRFHGIWMST